MRPSGSSPDRSGWSRSIHRRVIAHAPRFLVPLLLFTITLAAAWMLREQDRLAAEHARAIAGERSAASGLVEMLAGSRAEGWELRDVPIEKIRAHVSAATAMMPSLAGAWEPVTEALDRLATSGVSRQAVDAEVAEFQSVATGILVASDELLDTLLEEEAQSRAVHLAARQLMLIQRMSANAGLAAAGGNAMLGVADRLGRDAVLFGETLNALLDGDRTRGIDRIGDGPSRDVLESLARDYRASTMLLERILTASIDLRAAETHLGEVLRALAVVDRAMLRAATDVPAPPWPPIEEQWVRLLAALTLLTTLAAIAFVARSARGVSRLAETEAHSARVREAGWVEDVADLETRLRQMQQRVARLTEDTRRMAEGESVELEDESEPGIALLARTIRATLGASARQLQALRDSARVFASEARVLRESASAARMSTERHLEELEQAVQAVRALGDGADSVHRDVERLESAAAPVGEYLVGAREAERVWREALAGARETCDDALRQIRRATERTAALADVDAQVADVAEQTRMLSLNVSIHASAEPGVARSLERFEKDVEALSALARRAARALEAWQYGMRGALDAAEGAFKGAAWRVEQAQAAGGSARRELDGLDTASSEFERKVSDSTERAHAAATEVRAAQRTLMAARDIASRANTGVRLTAEAADALCGLASEFEGALSRVNWTTEPVGALIELEQVQPALPFDESEASEPARPTVRQARAD